ncbi:ABC transporter substrate-binding protein [Mesosutterella sp. OilRF-GAM-744-9]|uniref:ABC transporter substrate-binding protein n=1 Tax=Mesosutterella porci TaxID=2915351 RepID=A0ABS9MSU5_9BURK|nr:ABC transporter substrate-binding protein [Mesosutterella sp. oilRF-744-WT-GAM-9]MCG5031607.1 ABC transporter substrate-binding protein [Mesosutterella sp. oilRF-744-WT-GAM-9]
MSISRREFLTAVSAATALSAFPFGTAGAASLEKKSVKIAVGGRQLIYYLPLSVAAGLGYFKDEGLNVEIIDFQGGSKSLQAVVGGSADICSGAFEHTVVMQTRGQRMQAFVLQGRAPQCVLAINNHTMKHYKSLADLKGKKIGVTAPGSSSQIMANFCLHSAGIKPSQVSFIGIGTSSGAIAAIRSGQVDAFVQLDPVISMLMEHKEITVAVDTRKVNVSDKLYGGPMVAGCLYAPEAFIKKNPNTVQAIANAIVRADKWIAKAKPEDVLKVVPQSYQLGNRKLYIQSFLANRPALSKDGLIPAQAPETAKRALATVNPQIANARIDLSATFTNRFAEAANKRYR